MYNFTELEKHFAVFDVIEKSGGQIALTDDPFNSKQMIINVEGTFEKAQESEENTKETRNSAKQNDISIPINFDEIFVSDDYIEQKIARMNKIGLGVSESFREGLTESADAYTPYPVITKQGGDRDYMLFRNYAYKANDGSSIIAHEGFVTDLASVPRLFWLLINPDELSLSAPIIHDLLYRNGGKLPLDQVHVYRTFNRLNSDDIFLEIMERENIPNWRCRAAYIAVRKFGRSAWQGTYETSD